MNGVSGAHQLNGVNSRNGISHFHHAYNISINNVDNGANLRNSVNQTNLRNPQVSNVDVANIHAKDYNLTSEQIDNFCIIIHEYEEVMKTGDYYQQLRSIKSVMREWDIMYGSSVKKEKFLRILANS